MEAKHGKKIEYWQKHITAAESDPRGLSAYFRENGLNSATFYNWRDRLSGRGERISRKRRGKKAKKQIPAFLPVLMTESTPRYPTRQDLPDAKWLAEVIMEVHARCL